MRSWKRNSLMTGLLVLLMSVVLFSQWLTGCSANDPFDPDSLENQPPVARLFVTPSAEGEDLNPTSYFQRTFNWSGTDRDGWVEEFYISIRTDGDNPAPWDTTTSTDTTITFSPDPSSGEASATFLLACLDNKGAFSDTISQFIPMRNHPPVVAFQPDYEPLQNMQREFIYEGEAVVDTVFWNWGASNFRFFAYDLDGLSTMDSFFRYTLVDGGNPDQTWDIDDEDADPELGWVKVPFESGAESYEFEIFITNMNPGQRTLTVSVQDEAAGDPLFQYDLEVREPKNPVLLVSDATGPAAREMYSTLLDGLYGEGNWDQYNLNNGFPDKPFVLLESFRKFEVVVWPSGSSASSNLKTAAARDGVLWQYVTPLPESQVDGGRLLLISKNAVGGGADGLPAVFTTSVLGLNATGDPEEVLDGFDGHAAESQGGASYLPNFIGVGDWSSGMGLDPLEGTEILYRMEYCVGCYAARSRTHDPVVAIRRPHRDVDPLANVVCFSLQLEYFNNPQVITALEQVLIDEMGVVTP